MEQFFIIESFYNTQVVRPAKTSAEEDLIFRENRGISLLCEAYIIITEIVFLSFTYLTINLSLLHYA
jgi:hypothetical protein